MTYPLISEYIESIKMAEDNFATLTNLRPVLDDNGEPIMSSGNFAVVFKMKDIETGKEYAIKCFTKEQPGRSQSYGLISRYLEWLKSPYLLDFHFKEYEIFVNTTIGSETDYPVIIMDWVEGVTLDKYIARNINNTTELEILLFRFYQLSKWLLSVPIAHGDLKPDNILITLNGEIVLIDYDGMYVPEMDGQHAREIGSPDYQHPHRTLNDYDEHIDDFSICSILLSIKAIINSPSLFFEYAKGERLLFSKTDYLNIGSSKVFYLVIDMLSDSLICDMISLFLEAFSNKRLADHSFDRIKISIPNRVNNIISHHSDSIIKNVLKFKRDNKFEQFIQLCEDNIAKGIDVGENYFAIYMMYTICNIHNDMQIKCLEKATMLGYYDAKLYLAIELIKAWYPFKRDYQRGVQLLKECLSEKEDSIALTWLAQCYNEGWGVKSDGFEALKLFTKAANMNYSGAQCILGHWYNHGVFGANGVIHKIGQRQDLNKAIFWFKKASLQNNKEACWCLSRIYNCSKSRNIMLAKYYSDKVDSIQRKGDTSISSIEIIDAFDERKEDFIKCGERKLNIDEINSIEDIRVKNLNGVNYFLIKCKEITEFISFSLTHISMIRIQIVPALINVIEYKIKGKYQSYYKLEYEEI